MSSEILFGVYGASGFGKEVIPLVHMQLQSQKIEAHRIVFIDDAIDDSNENFLVNGYKVLTYAEFLAQEAKERCVVVAIANDQVRENLTLKLIADNVKIINIFAPNAVILDDVEIGYGAILCPFVTVTSSIKIGLGFHANIYSYIGHDCVIGDFVTFAPRVSCNGNVIIEDHAYIGTGAIIKQGRPGKPIVIGRGAIVGMGAVVTKNVPPGVTVIGNPAKPLSRQSLK